MPTIPVATLTGLAQFTGVGGQIAIASVAIYPMQKSLKFTHKFELQKFKSPNGFTIGWGARDESYELKIGMMLVDSTGYTTTPSAGTIAHAITGTYFPLPLAIVQLSGFGGADAADCAWINDYWQVQDGSDIDLKQLEEGELNLNLLKYTSQVQQALMQLTPGA
jgi:hypothetical protein